MKAYPSSAEGWMTFLLGGAASTADLEALERWRRENPRLGRELDLLRQGWDAAAGLLAEPVVAESVASTGGELVAFPSRRRGPALWLAAALATVVALSLLWGRTTAPPTELFTARGEQRTVTLRDGTALQLNTGTRLTVSADEKRIEIEDGEAYFDVTPQGREPFHVLAGRVAIQVVGTEFNVLRRPGGGVAISVPEGRVEVSLPEVDAETYTVTVGQAVEVPAAGSAVRYLRDPSELRRVEAWRAGKIELDRTPLVDAVAELSRYAPVSIELADASLEAVPVSGVFRIDRMADVDSLVFALESSLPVAARHVDGTLRIFKEPRTGS